MIICIRRVLLYFQFFEECCRTGWIVLFRTENGFSQCSDCQKMFLYCSSFQLNNVKRKWNWRACRTESKFTFKQSFDSIDPFVWEHNNNFNNCWPLRPTAAFMQHPNLNVFIFLKVNIIIIINIILLNFVWKCFYY